MVTWIQIPDTVSCIYMHFLVPIPDLACTFVSPFQTIDTSGKKIEAFKLTLELLNEQLKMLTKEGSVAASTLSAQEKQE